MKDLEVLNVMVQIRHVFGGESLIWRMKEGVSDVQGVWQGHRRNSRSRTDGISSVDMRGLCGPFAFSSMRQISVPSAWDLDQDLLRGLYTFSFLCFTSIRQIARVRFHLIHAQQNVNSRHFELHGISLISTWNLFSRLSASRARRIRTLVREQPPPSRGRRPSRCTALHREMTS